MFPVHRLIAAKRQHFLDSRSPVGAQRLFPTDSIYARESVVAEAAAAAVGMFAEAAEAAAAVAAAAIAL